MAEGEERETKGGRGEERVAGKAKRDGSARGFSGFELQENKRTQCTATGAWIWQRFFCFFVFHFPYKYLAR